MRATRREALGTLARVAAALAATGGVAALARRSGRACPRTNPCSQCAALRGCSLPEAARARQAAGR